jgi:hypothetical protein
MILDKEVEIRITSRNLKYYKNSGYNIKINDIVKININHISAHAHIKINCQCDFCDNKTYIEYRNYFIVLNHNDNKYMCKECGKFKTSNTIKEKYKNLEWATEITERTKQTKIKKYNDPYYSNRKKYVETMNNNFGVDNPSQLNDVKQKKTETFFKNYGVKHYFMSD